MTDRFRLSKFSKASSSPVPYTGDPVLLCYADVLLFIKNIWSVPGILHPWNQWNSGKLDELYPSISNLICLALHGFLIVLQIVFLCSIPFLVVVPVWMMLLYVAVVMAVNYAICWVLNGTDSFLESKIELGDDVEKHMDECWIFLNGVSVGKHWLQCNLDRLALTFRRSITGIPNRTCGIVFDLLQCVVERNFCYPTWDIRKSYALIKERLLAEEHKKVILILHSQGGIEGGLILDWLLSELPHDVIHKLEIYTFGCAANHFNNPHRSSAKMDTNTTVANDDEDDKAVRHIEHYAHDGDFVARWGVLSFIRTENRYMGRVFTRSGMGHLMNQHYLNSMFPLGEDKRVAERNSFMDSGATFTSEEAADKARNDVLVTMLNGGVGTAGAIVEDFNSPVEPVSLDRAESALAAKLAQKKPKVRDFSRLWEYRNGRRPET